MLGSSKTAYLDDEALSTLSSIYETMLAERSLPCGSPGAEELATRIVNLYLGGTTDKDEILHLLDRPHAA